MAHILPPHGAKLITIACKLNKRMWTWTGAVDLEANLEEAVNQAYWEVNAPCLSMDTWFFAVYMDTNPFGWRLLPKDAAYN